MLAVETCQCGATHHPGHAYYVSVVDGPQFNVLAGPYETHAAALADVKGVREVAERVNAKAVFYAFGTVVMKDGYRTPGLFNREGLWPPKQDAEPSAMPATRTRRRARA